MRNQTNAAIAAAIESFHKSEFQENGVPGLGVFVAKQMQEVHNAYQNAVLECMIKTLMEGFPAARSEIDVPDAEWNKLQSIYQAHAATLITNITYKFRELAEDPSRAENAAAFVENRVKKFINHVSEIVKSAEDKMFANMTTEEKFRYDAINKELINSIK